MARLIGQQLSDRLGQPFVLENRPGAGTNIATEAVVKAPPDGYTLLAVDAAPAINTTLYHNLNFAFLRDIAPVAPATPSELLPDIPALSEFLPGYDAAAWMGISAPANTPPEIIDRLNKEINAALTDTTLKLRLAELGSSAVGGSPADYARLLAEEAEKWGKVIRAANIKPE